MKLLDNITSKLILLAIISSLTSTASHAAVSSPDLANKEVKVKEVTAKSIVPVARYEMISNSENKTAVVFINKQEIIRYAEEAGGFSPEQRAKILTSRLNKFISSNCDAKTILPGFENTFAVVRANKEILLTVDRKTAESKKVMPGALAIQVSNNIRTALNAPKIVRNNSMVASRGITPSFAGRTSLLTQEGFASWYGGHFHGRRAADGSRFNKHEHTAAHKTLPFGTLVRVTNKNNGKACIVKITDRGPFVSGRVIDLSKAAASTIGMLSSGVAPVQIEVISR